MEWIDIIGIAIGICGWWDARRERGKREEAVILALTLIGRLNGALITIKPAVAHIPGVEIAINDCLDAIKQTRPALEKL